MDLQFFVTLTVLSGFAVTIAQEILKLKIVPVPFANRYPVPTCLVLSVVASFVALWTQNALHVASWLEIAGTVGVTALVAAMTYNNLFSNWKQLKDIEGEK